MSLISVVIPCYNMPGDWLDEAVNSVRRQTHPDVETIIVDDGSTAPDTLSSLKRWADYGLQVIHQENSGTGHALNTGIRAAKGEYFLTLNDDLIDPPYLAEAWAAMESDPKVGIVYCHATLFGAQSGPWRLPPFSMKTQLLRNCIFAASLFRRQDWATVGGFDEASVGWEDYDFILRILGLNRTVVQLEGTYFHYRRPTDRATRNVRIGVDRTAQVSAFARVFRNNRELYASHAESLFENIFDLMDQRNDLANRYRHLERFRLSRFGGRVWSLVRGARRMLTHSR